MYRVKNLNNHTITARHSLQHIIKYVLKMYIIIDFHPKARNYSVFLRPLLTSFENKN